MRTYWRRLVFPLLSFVFCSVASAQTNPNLEIGFKPFGAYDDTSFDSVNVDNGNLELHIPLFDYPFAALLSAIEMNLPALALILKLYLSFQLPSLAYKEWST